MARSRVCGYNPNLFEDMGLAAGTRFGPFEILAALGAGGMGEVYRARDTRLKREVAIKVLPEGYSRDTDRITRFQREAELLASLNHPNIAAVYGVEVANGASAIVLELVEGETLAEKLEQLSTLKSRGSGSGLSLDEAIPMARQIVDALEAAHERGIIHRDLKPANIKITPDGKVKVLDFGLAKALESGGGSPHAVSGAGDGSPQAAYGDPSPLSMSPTLGVQGTLAGMILGTAAYMSPEQARGKPVDKRTDIWAFGCVLFEMLTGQQVFPAGETVSDAVAAILTREPDWRRLPAAAPGSVLRLLRRCLEKEPPKRLRDIADARFELDEALQQHAADAIGPSPAAPPVRRSAWRVAMFIAGLALAASAIVVWREARAVSSVADPVAFAVAPPDGATLVTPLAPPGFPWLALSPDGRTLAFVALAADGRQQLWTRSLTSTASAPVAGTDDARAPFWSADGRYLAFFAQRKLKYVSSAAGSLPQELADAPHGYGGAWSRDNTILFNSQNTGEGLRRVRLNETVSAPATRIDRRSGMRGHQSPQFLPDGRHFIYAAVTADGTNPETWVASLDDDGERLLLRSNGSTVYAWPGYLIFSRGGTLWAQRFNAAMLSLDGDPIRIADGVAGNGPSAYTAVSASANGVLAYGTTPPSNPQLAWRDRNGRPVVQATFDRATNPALSPDGRMLAANRSLPQTGIDVWLFDLKREAATRFTTDAAADFSPVWSPDAKSIAFTSSREGRFERLFTQDVDGARPATLVSDIDVSIPTDWSKDGRSILFHTNALFGPGWQLWTVSPAERKPRPLLDSTFNQIQGALSPDGHWLAYASDESGILEVYVRPFGVDGPKSMVSRGGGSEPRWRSDGRELFYVSADRRLMALTVNAGASLETGKPDALFEMNVRDLAIPFRRRYDVTPDGQRFVIQETAARNGQMPLTVIVNWTGLLRR